MFKLNEQQSSILVILATLLGAGLVGWGIYAWLGVWGLVGTVVGLGVLAFLYIVAYANHMRS